MGIEYELIDHSRKEYIGLGYRKPFHRQPGAYQMPAERIKAFCRGRGRLVMISDSHLYDPTIEEEGWRCVGRWWWEDEEYRLFGQGLMSQDGHDLMESVTSQERP